MDEKLVERLVAIIAGELLGTRQKKPQLRVVGKDYKPEVSEELKDQEPSRRGVGT